MPQPEPSTVPSLEMFAGQSNTNLVYAHDEFGNQLAVGLMVTDEFMGKEQPNKGNVIKDDDINWVGAVEECGTQGNGGLDEAVDAKPMITEPI